MKHSYVCNASNLCIISEMLYTRVALFTLPEKYVLQFKKIATFGRFSAATRSNVFFDTGAAKRRSAKQRHIFRGRDIRAKQNSVHEGTAALQQRYTDECATQHMTPTAMELDSYTF